MRKYVITLFIASITALSLRVFFDASILKPVWMSSLLIGIALSGTAVSGDRMRANQSTGRIGYEKSYFLYPLIVCLPFFILSNFF